MKHLQRHISNYLWPQFVFPGFCTSEQIHSRFSDCGFVKPNSSIKYFLTIFFFFDCVHIHLLRQMLHKSSIEFTVVKDSSMELNLCCSYSSKFMATG